MINFLRSFDECVGDAAEFLGVARSEFFRLATAWPIYVNHFHSFDKPEDFYRGWVGDAGRSNLCANIIDQFSRMDIATILGQLPSAGADGRPFSFADIGCGTAALTFPLAPKLARLHLVDLPNMAQDFLAWRCRKHGIENVVVGGIDDVTDTVDVMACIDVLEHIATSSAFFRAMDRMLAPGGILLLRAPWHSISPHVEHLPEAELDWTQSGGAELLAGSYILVHPLPGGGLFRKKS